MSKKINWNSRVVLTILFLTSYQALAQNKNEVSSYEGVAGHKITRAMDAYGMYLTIEYGLKRIMDESDTFSNAANRTYRNWVFTYGEAKLNMENYLFEENDLNLKKRLTERRIREKVKGQNIEPKKYLEMIDKFISVKDPKGVVMLATLFEFQYLNKPELEIYSGRVKKLKIAHDTKSHEPSLVLTLPVTWREVESSKYNNHAIRDGNGTGDFSFTITELPLLNLANYDMSFILDSIRSMKNVLQDSMFQLLNHEEVILGMLYKGVRNTYLLSTPEIKSTNYLIMYHFIANNRSYNFSYSILDNKQGEKMKKYKKAIDIIHSTMEIR